MNVDPNARVHVSFDHPMGSGMEQYADLHEGDVRGPQVPGMWTWSEGHMEMTFTPANPLMHATEYTIHLGGGMQDEHGQAINFERHGLGMGGTWASEEMMGPGQMMGQPHAGDGWRHQNGSYGMVFTFTTSG